MMGFDRGSEPIGSEVIAGIEIEISTPAATEIALKRFICLSILNIYHIDLAGRAITKVVVANDVHNASTLEI